MLAQAIRERWISLHERYTSDSTFVLDSYAALAADYSNSSRHYHTLEHLSAMLELQREYENDIRDNDTVLFAIFFHDVVYSAIRTDNEDKSALAAEAHLRKIGYPPERAANAGMFIRATRTHQNLSGDTDLDYLLDFDLQILGAPPETYRAYRQQIRREYALYPDLVYRPGRRKAMQHFLDMPYIYKTAAFRKLYEAPARENIMGEMDGL